MAEPVYGTLSGFAAAAAAADRRRAGTLRTVGLALVVALVGAGTTSRVLERASSADRLEVTTTPDERWERPSARPAPPAPPVRRAGAAPGGTVSRGTTQPRPGDVPASPTATGPYATPSPVTTTPVPIPAASPVRVSQSNPVTRIRGGFSPACENQIATATGCTVMDGPYKMGHHWVIVGRYCADGGSATGREHHFAENVEAEFRVTDDRGVLRWSSLPDHPRYPSPHKEVISKASCPGWETRWTRRGNDGGRLPAGTYRISMLVRSPDAGGAEVVEQAFTLP